MSELKACPFCGGEAVEKRTGAAYSSKYEVVCTKCGCKTFKTVASPSHINAWNTRHRETCRNESTRLDEARFHCSNCGHGCWVKDVADGRDKLPNYCPNCGAKVVDS